MTIITDAELQAHADDFVMNLPVIQAEITNRLASTSVSGNPFNSISDARVIGAYGGYAPGLLLGGVEVQILYAYDQVTQEVGIFFYTGGTIGPSIGIPVAGDALAGVFLFEGDLQDMSGFSWGVQATSGFAAGLSATIPEGDRLLQLGIEIGVAGEGTAGYTFDVTPDISEPVVDWQLTEQNLNRLFGSQPDVLQAILGELAIARSLGGGWENDFTEKYGDAIIFNARQCFPAHTPITLANGSTIPIADIRVGDEVLSFKSDGSLVSGTVDKLFRNTTQEFVRLFFDDGRDDLVATPGHRFLTETGDFMEIGQMVRLGGGAVRLVEKDGSIVTARGEVLAYSQETAHLFEQAQAKATIYDGNLAVKHDAESGWATYNFEVREHHTYIANDIRVHNDSILSFLEEGDTVYALTDDLKDMAVARDTDGDGVNEIVLLDGERFTDVNGGDTFLEVQQTFIPNDPNADVEALLAQFIENNTAAAGNVYDPGLGNGPGDGVASDDIVEILTDDIGGTFSDRTFGGVPVPTLDALILAAVTGGAGALIETLFAPLGASETSLGYNVGDGDTTVTPAGPDSTAILLFILGLDAGAEIVPGIPSPFGGTIGGLTLGDLLGQLALPTLGNFALNFGPGIVADDVTREAVGDDLVMMIDNGDGTSTAWTLEDVYADGNADEIASVNFADGTSVSLEDIADGSVNPDGVVTGTDLTDIIDDLFIDAEGEGATEGADTILALGGDDLIFALGGDDTIDGGSGNDVIDGGEGSDTVLVEGDWTDFTFAPDIIFGDAAGADFTMTDTNSVSTVDDGTDSLTSVESIVFSDGTTGSVVVGMTTTDINFADADNVSLGRAAIDTGDTRAWASFIQILDENGQLTSQTTTYDDGRVYAEDYANGVLASMSLTDPNNAAPWSTIERSYDANGDITNQVFVYDDGRTSDTDYVNGVRTNVRFVDVNNTATWDTIERTYDANGDLSDQVIISDVGSIADSDYANGVRTSISINDAQDAFVWDTIDQTYDETGAFTAQSLVYDDGRVYENTYENGIIASQTATDPLNAVAWQSLARAYDSAGDLFSQTITYDNGNIVTTFYDDLLVG